MKNETKRTLLRAIEQKVMRLRAVSIYAIIKVLLRSNGITKWRLKLYIKFKWIFFTCFLCSVMEFNVFSFSLFFSSVTFTSTFKARHSRRSFSMEAKNVRYGRPNQTYFINFCLRREKKVCNRLYASHTYSGRHCHRRRCRCRCCRFIDLPAKYRRFGIELLPSCTIMEKV